MKARLPESQSLRILCIDGGGMKGYTALLILRRLFRTIAAEGGLSKPPLPCEVFDLICGTSTGGLISVMLGRLHMSIDDCITVYERLGKEVFGKRRTGGILWKLMRSLFSAPVYDVENLQEQIRKVLSFRNIPLDTPFFEEPAPPLCKVMLCVTRVATSKPDVLRSYESVDPTAENYECTIWEAASATAAAPMFFGNVKFAASGERFCDGALRRNNPIHEALAEVSREKEWKNKEIGCIVSIGCGFARSNAVSSSLTGFLKDSVKIMTDANDIAKVFAASAIGVELAQTNRYFRFSVPQGMEDLQLDEWKKTERMSALAMDYLGHAAVGMQVEQCAKSLCYPDENLKRALKPKPSFLPYGPCTHFVERPFYDSRLKEFFSPRLDHRELQIFVLWGSGGVGKTQIAVNFAHALKRRMSVFWIRADSLANFSVDFCRVYELLQTKDGTKVKPESITSQLNAARKLLEETTDDWLLVLDNADHLESFLGSDNETNPSESEKPSISSYIPRTGRILITTRDSRFQGSVAAAEDGERVDIMGPEEAEDLLFKSVPSHLVKQSAANKLMAQDLVKELGFLPLAIAQAAANIVDQQLDFAEYVRLYREKKDRMNLIKAPALDFANTDPKGARQSVIVTWEVSLDILRRQSPESITLLNYFACFNNFGIEKFLVRLLPEFKDMDDKEFIAVVKKPLRLSLIEQFTYNEDPDQVTYSIHPLLHEVILQGLSKDELEKHVPPVLTMFAYILTNTDQSFSQVLRLMHMYEPHAAHVVELAQGINHQSLFLALLLKRLSTYYTFVGELNKAASKGSVASTIVNSLLGKDDPVSYWFRRGNITNLIMAARYEEAENEIGVCLKGLDTPEIMANFGGKTGIEEERLALLTDLSNALRGRHGYAYEGLESIHLEQLSNESFDPRTYHGVIIQHNLAHILHKLGRDEEALQMNSILLSFAETDEGKKCVPLSLKLIMLNLRALLLRMDTSDGLEEVLEIYDEVYRQSMDKFGICAVDTWKAIMNNVCTLIVALRNSECARILEEVLRESIEKKVKAEGAFISPMATIQRYLNVFFSSTEFDDRGVDSETLALLRELKDQWLYISQLPEDPSKIPPVTLVSTYNSRGVLLQGEGRFMEAATIHRQTLTILLNESPLDQEWISLARYNLMLAIGRDGKLEEALRYRTEYFEEISTKEAIYGTLEKRLEEMQQENELYEIAKERLLKGEGEKGDEWWLQHAKALKKAERRLGVLQGSPTQGGQNELRVLGGSFNMEKTVVKVGEDCSTSASRSSLLERLRHSSSLFFRNRGVTSKDGSGSSI